MPYILKTYVNFNTGTFPAFLIERGIHQNKSAFCVLKIKDAHGMPQYRREDTRQYNYGLDWTLEHLSQEEYDIILALRKLPVGSIFRPAVK